MPARLPHTLATCHPSRIGITGHFLRSFRDRYRLVVLFPLAEPLLTTMDSGMPLR